MATKGKGEDFDANLRSGEVGQDMQLDPLADEVHRAVDDLFGVSPDQRASTLQRYQRKWMRFARERALQAVESWGQKYGPLFPGGQELVRVIARQRNELEIEPTPSKVIPRLGLPTWIVELADDFRARGVDGKVVREVYGWAADELLRAANAALVRGEIKR